MTGEDSKPKGVAALDKWTLVHFLAGLALGWLGLGLLNAGLVLIGYEAFEMQLRKVPADGSEGAFTAGLLEYESQQNIIADVLAGLAGWLAGRYLR